MAGELPQGSAMNSQQPYIEYPFSGYAAQNVLPTHGDRSRVQRPQPMLDFEEESAAQLADQVKSIPRRLFLVPTRDDYPGSEYDRTLAASEQSEGPAAPTPTPIDELPDLEDWITKFVYSLIEIWNGSRPAMQLARWSHRRVFATLVTQVGAFAPAPKIRRVHIHQPIEGVAESVVLLRIGNRVRSLILRFEGVDKRWVCTQMWLL